MDRAGGPDRRGGAFDWGLLLLRWGRRCGRSLGSQFGYAEELFRTVDGGQMHLDLWEANRRQLLDAGVKAERITVVGECTACAVCDGERKYFSHRAEHGFTGRMMSVVGVAG